MFPLTALLEVGGKLGLQGLFGRFSSSQPKINSVIGQPCFFAPFSHRQGFTKCGDKPRVSSIFGLIFSSGPCAIFRAITLFIVNALNTKAMWSFTHVAQKIGKLKPTVANRDASTTVIFVSLAFMACASFFNAFPYLIGRRSLPTQSVPM